MSSITSAAVWSTVAVLPDYLLLSQTRQLARHEQALQILVLDHLCEIEARSLHLRRGYRSLFDYVVRELDYTAAAAWRRIKAMRLCSATNGARELLQDGNLNLSNAAQLQNLFERSDRNHGGPPGDHATGGDLGGSLRSDGSAGEPAPMRAGEHEPAAGAAPVLDAAARERLVKQAAGKSTREVQQMLAEVDPELEQPNDRMRALGNGAAGYGSAEPALRSPALQRHLAVLRYASAVPGSRSRYIPAAVRREVWRRDRGCCSYVDRHSGRRCGSRYRLEIDHIVPFALGGAGVVANLRVRCRAHHRLPPRHATSAARVAGDSADAPARSGFRGLKGRAG